MNRLIWNLRQAWRGLASTRGTAMLATATLAIGLGVNTAVFSILDSLLFRPVPYAEASRLRELWAYYAPGKFSIQGQFEAPLVALWRTQTDLFDRVEATAEKTFIFEGAGGAEMVRGVVVTPGLMPMLGVRAERGRTFADGDGRDGSDRLTIISRDFWSQRLGSDPEAIGRRIALDGQLYEIVGIMPATFRFPDQGPELWLPFDVERPLTRAQSGPSGPGMSIVTNEKFTGVVRLKPGLTTEVADALALARGAELHRRAGGDGDTSAKIMTIGELFDERTGRSLWVLGGAVVFLLLIVCANVANLTLARSLARSRDLAVRAALGASRGDLFRAALLEHVMLGAAGAVLGVGLAYLGIAAANSVLPQSMTNSSMNAIDLDWRTLGFLAAAALATVMVFGVPPAFVASRASIVTALGQQSRSATGSAAARRLRGALVVIEVALSIVLLVGAALMTRSLLKLQAIDVGMDPEGLVAASVALPMGAYDDPVAQDLFTARAIEALRREPGIHHASAGPLPPEENGSISVGVLEFADRPPTPGTKKTLLYVYPIWPGYFQTAGIRLLEGREPTDADVEGAAVVSHDFAKKHWMDRSAIGARFRVGTAPWRTVVGVAAEVRRMSEDDDSRQQEIYYPHDQESGTMTATRPSSTIAEYRSLIVRADDPGAIMRTISRVVHEIDPRVIVSGTKLVATQFTDAIARPRIVFLMMTIFAAVGLLLAAAGLYGVLSYLVSLRTREIGVRLALGASRRKVGVLVLRNGLVLVIAGMVIGLSAAAALVQVMRTLLYAIEPTDPLAVAGAIAFLFMTALFAAWLPARRAMRVDPVVLLRES